MEPGFSVGRFDVHYVIALRNPISVADSLSRRDGFAPEKSYLMWVDHMLTILRETAESAYVMVDYDQIVTAPETALDRLASF